MHIKPMIINSVLIFLKSTQYTFFSIIGNSKVIVQQLFFKINIFRYSGIPVCVIYLQNYTKYDKIKTR